MKKKVYLEHVTSYFAVSDQTKEIKVESKQQLQNHSKLLKPAYTPAYKQKEVAD